MIADEQHGNPAPLLILLGVGLTVACLEVEAEAIRRVERRVVLDRAAVDGLAQHAGKTSFTCGHPTRHQGCSRHSPTRSRCAARWSFDSCLHPAIGPAQLEDLCDLLVNAAVNLRNDRLACRLVVGGHPAVRMVNACSPASKAQSATPISRNSVQGWYERVVTTVSLSGVCITIAPDGPKDGPESDSRSWHR